MSAPRITSELTTIYFSDVFGVSSGVLEERGFRAPKDSQLLVVLDGAKGLHAAVRDVFGKDTPAQRCQWHT